MAISPISAFTVDPAGARAFRAQMQAFQTSRFLAELNAVEARPSSLLDVTDTIRLSPQAIQILNGADADALALPSEDGTLQTQLNLPFNQGDDEDLLPSSPAPQEIIRKQTPLEALLSRFGGQSTDALSLARNPNNVSVVPTAQGYERVADTGRFERVRRVEPV